MLKCARDLPLHLIHHGIFKPKAFTYPISILTTPPSQLKQPRLLEAAHIIPDAKGGQQELDGERIWTPNGKNNKPDNDALEERYAEFEDAA